MVETQKVDFLNYEIWILTFGGGFQRAGVYADNVDDQKKSEFRAAIRKNISSIVKDHYKDKDVSSDAHIETIVKIKKWIDNNYSQILTKGEIKLGVVQKILNLYLKYQWCLELVPIPPHCPFDRIIISKMKLRNPPAWTKINSVETYKMLVNKASELANNKTIAEWELDVFFRK